MPDVAAPWTFLGWSDLDELRAAVAVPQVWDGAPVDLDAERAVVNVWRQLTPATARRYVATMRRPLALARQLERDQGPAPVSKPIVPSTVLAEPGEQVGSYVVEGVLGAGGDGQAYRVHHVATGAVATLKIPARGEGSVLHRLTELGGTWSPHLVRVFDGGARDGEEPHLRWVVREYATGTLAEQLRERGPLSLTEALEIFRVCCIAVAWLHSRQIFRWSAHLKNLFLVDGAWKVGDLGRSVCFVPHDHWAVEMSRQAIRSLAWDTDGVLPLALVDELVDHRYWGHPTGAGFWTAHPERERRLALDDCAMLGGLLAVLLSGRRWAWFAKALASRPYCSAHYALTGHRITDAALSGILNRCWRGDAGGALLLANEGRGEQSTYDDPLALLADVEQALGVGAALAA